MDHLLKNLGGVTLKSLLENPSLLQPTVGSNADDPSSKGASGKQGAGDFLLFLLFSLNLTTFSDRVSRVSL